VRAVESIQVDQVDSSLMLIAKPDTHFDLMNNNNNNSSNSEASHRMSLMNASVVSESSADGRVSALVQLQTLEVADLQ